MAFCAMAFCSTALSHGANITSVAALPGYFHRTGLTR
jgi:hypothetical protein